MTENYIIHNGLLKKEKDLNLSVNNRAFLYGDGFFETMVGFNNRVSLLEHHIRRLNRAIEALNFIPLDILRDKQGLEELITYLARKNKLFKRYRIRISIFRNSGGLYCPVENSISYTIQVQKLEKDNFELNLVGLAIDLYDEVPKNYSKISFFKSNNSLPYVLAAQYAKANKLDDVVLLNSDKNIVETSNSNIFFVLDNKVYTPRIEDGCIDGIYRHIIINILKENDELVEASLSTEIIEKADEIFLTNSVSGMRYVSIFRQHRYYHRFLASLFDKISVYLSDLYSAS